MEFKEGFNKFITANIINQLIYSHNCFIRANFEEGNKILDFAKNNIKELEKIINYEKKELTPKYKDLAINKINDIKKEIMTIDEYIKLEDYISSSDIIYYRLRKKIEELKLNSSLV